jgi:diguanylate cyclase (GGDEF)-like protein
MEHRQKDGDWVPLILRSTAGAPSRMVCLASILAMVSIFGLDSADGSKISLNVLYVFPIAASAFYCERTTLVALGAAIAGGLQLLTLIAYETPVWSIAANIIIELASAAVIVILTRHARSKIARMEALAVTDELTRLPNRRGVESVIRREIAKQRRYGGALSVALLDLDRFKEVNDYQGHAAGDRALKLIGAVLSQYTRESDSVARLGGDEFVIVMPRTQRAECAALCRSLSRAIIRRMTVADLSITASIGFATFEEAPGSVSMALQKADRAMYADKASRSRLRVEQTVQQRAQQHCGYGVPDGIAVNASDQRKRFTVP